jgi:hypothetical protein
MNSEDFTVAHRYATGSMDGNQYIGDARSSFPDPAGCSTTEINNTPSKSMQDACSPAQTWFGSLDSPEKRSAQ